MAEYNVERRSGGRAECKSESIGIIAIILNCESQAKSRGKRRDESEDSGDHLIGREDERMSCNQGQK
jgi:hypothetical protein